MPAPAAPRRGEAGYNLVILIVAITVLNIMVAVALPLWSQAIRRDRERELISRGLQYAEGIRVFQQRFGRLPVRLEELVEVEPRCMRRLWKDPMTESGKWVLVFEGQEDVPPPSPDGRGPGQPPRIGGDPTGGEGGDDEEDGGEEEENGEELDPNAPPEAGDEVAVGPIIGVRSRSRDESILVFLGQERHDRWIFRADVFAQRPLPVGNPHVAATFNPNWWRPFRGGIVPPGAQQPPGVPPGDGPGNPPPPRNPPPEPD